MKNYKNSTFGFGMHYYKKCIPVAVLTQLMSFAATVADLILPLILEMFIDYVICSNIPSQDSFFSLIFDLEKYPVHSWSLFIHLLIFSLSVLFIRIVLVYTKNLLNQIIGLKLETSLRYETYRKLMSLDSQTLSSFNSGELLQTINGDTIMYKDLFSLIIPAIADSIFALVLSIGILAKMSLWLLLVPGILTPVFVIELNKFKKISREKFEAIRSGNAAMNLTVQENIAAVRLVRAFTNEDFEEKKFNAANENLKKSHLEQISLSAKFEAVFNSIKQTAYIGTIAVSTLLVFSGHFQIGALVACSNYVLKIMNYVTNINNYFFRMQQQLVSGSKMMNFMAKKSAVKDKDESYENEKSSTENFKINGGKKGVFSLNKNIKPEIIIKNASLSIDGNSILQNICVDIPYGKKLGITGSTGSGKSMLLETLVRNFELTDGGIFINGRNLRSYSLKELRSMFSYVFQEAFLFSNTIAANIDYAEKEDADFKDSFTAEEKEKIITAAKHAQAHDFVMKLPDEYETVVGERGMGLSGGQKQRLSIARALMKNAGVIILDDSTSALDTETEHKLLEDIKTYYPEKTIIICAHKISSLKDCDEILYMKDGQIAERGTFDELIKLNGHFAKVYEIQMMQKKSLVDYNSIKTPEN
ncbi:MAG: ABC transporter ATP-binding protein/permease [Spirochaetia bacterium]|nr:ABC transporter ATP-binding protein/permease [Spirochaetia bacterium]